ncbi:MAG TPA: DNA repair protein RadC [Cyclobacteriaceae bacterium]|nr:DNA repair protein RadC [Cyclobacteriaceae bacterium]
MEIEETRPLSIKDWSLDDRPREKLIQKGTASLSDAELIAILIGSGTANMNAVEVSKKLMQLVENSLAELSRLSVKDLMRVRGIGEVRAVTITAALELGRRRKELDTIEKAKISSSKDAFDQLEAELMDLPHEEFWVLLVNRAHRVIKKKRISEGGVSGTVADPKIIFKMALEELASGVIVAHNHPSGNMTASQSDIELTRKLQSAGKFLEIQLLDHLIFCGRKYFSFADQGML